MFKPACICSHLTSSMEDSFQNSKASPFLQVLCKPFTTPSGTHPNYQLSPSQTHYYFLCVLNHSLSPPLRQMKISENEPDFCDFPSFSAMSSTHSNTPLKLFLSLPVIFNFLNSVSTFQFLSNLISQKPWINTLKKKHFLTIIPIIPNSCWPFSVSLTRHRNLTKIWLLSHFPVKNLLFCKIIISLKFIRYCMSMVYKLFIVL